MSEFRIERDSMGQVRVPAQAYYGAQTQRAKENFPISGWHLPVELIRALGLVKLAAAIANRDLGKMTGSGKNPLTDPQVEALLTACREVAAGKFDDQFPIDVFQTGSGTSSNMNANEVISNRAIELTGGDRFSPDKPIHPNDHVNMGQSTNDMFPTAIHVAVARRSRTISCRRWRGCATCWPTRRDSGTRSSRLAARTWPTPRRFAWGRNSVATRGKSICRSIARRWRCKAVSELPAGGTAVGTGINTHPKFGAKVAEVLARETGVNFVEAVNHFEANANRDGLVECSGDLRTVAVSLFSLSNNIRWLSSGPRCGFFEVMLPDRQPGSSIMPGKVNPVMCESMMQVCARVIGNDQTLAFSGATGGNFELNIMMPVMGHVVLESVRLLASSARAFVEFCALEMEANREACEAAVEKSLAMVTSLNPHIGYERAAALAKEAFKSGKTIRQLCQEQNILPEKVLSEALDPWSMTEPH